MNTVLVPCFKRPEMLFLCLEALSKAEGIEGHSIRVLQDRKLNADVDERIAEVVGLFRGSLNLDFELRPANDDFGNDRNLLEAYKEEHQKGTPYVFLVEEDVIVGDDFFTWHYAVQERMHVFCSIASAHADMPKSEDPDLCFLARNYCSLGVCFPSRSLSLLVEHATPNYYRHLREYVLENFRPEVNAHFGGGYAQDGLISRIIIQEGLTCAWAARPRCFHTGIYGYNRDQQSPLRPGTWREQAKELKERWGQPTWMTAKYADCVPCDLGKKPMGDVRFESHVA